MPVTLFISDLKQKCIYGLFDRYIYNKRSLSPQSNPMSVSQCLYPRLTGMEDIHGLVVDVPMTPY